MIKAQLLFIIAVTSGFLLTIQLIALQYIVTKGKPELDPFWLLLQSVVSESSANSIPLFVIDDYLLMHLNNYSNKYSYCRVLCKNRETAALATFGHFANYVQLNKLTGALREKGLTVIEYADFDPTLLHLNIKVSQPLHLLIFNDKTGLSHAVHVVILYERINAKYWYRGPLQLTNFERRVLQGRGIRRVAVSDTASIYEKVEIKIAVIDGLILGVPVDIKPFLPQNHRKFIECNKTRASVFHTKYGKDESDAAATFRTKATRMFLKVRSLLDKLQIPFWLSSGTCLGYFRQCDWIPYTRDVDIGIFIKDFNASLTYMLSMNDLPLLHSFGKVEDSYELSFRDGDLKMDIFFFYEEKDYTWNGGTQARTGLKFKYIFRPFTLCWTEFLEVAVRVPCNTQAYIEDNYGPSWFEPIKQWNWKESPANVRPNGHWRAEEGDKVIQMFPTFE